MDDHIKRALEQVRGLSLTDDITRATQNAQDLIYGPAGSAVRQVMDQLNRDEERRTEHKVRHYRPAVRLFQSSGRLEPGQPRSGRRLGL